MEKKYPTWDLFKAKYPSEQLQRDRFEDLVRSLFCDRFGIKYGLFQCYNHAGNETDTIIDGTDVIGFNAKFFAEKIDESQIIHSIEVAHKRHPEQTKMLIYTNMRFGNPPTGKAKTHIQESVDSFAASNGITIEWVTDKMILDHVIKINWVYEYFFEIESALEKVVKSEESNTKSILAPIKTSMSMGESLIKIDYSVEQEQVKSAILEKKHIVVFGEGGCGKTALLKSIWESVRDRISICIRKAQDIKNSRIDNLFEGGLDVFLEAFRDVEKKVMVIDSAERIQDIDDTTTIESFISRLKDGGWTFVFTVRDSFLESLLEDLNFLYRIAPTLVRIEPLSIDSLKELAENYNFKLPSNEAFQDRLCTLFYLNLYLNLYADLDRINSNSKFSELIWREKIAGRVNAGGKAIKRSKMFLDFIQQRVARDDFYLSDDRFDPEITQLLVDDEVLARNDNGLFITHDIYEEWGLAKAINKKWQEKRSVNSFFDSLNSSFLVRKAFRQWLKNIIESNLEDIQELLSKSFDPEIQDLWKDEILIGIMESSYASRFLENEKEVLLEDNAKLLNRIVFLLQLACKRLDKVIQHEGYEYPFYVPFGSGWNAVIHILFELKEHNIPVAYKLTVLKEWTANNKQGQATREAGLMALNIWASTEKEGTRIYDKELIKDLCEITINSAKEIKSEISKLIKKIVENKWNTHLDPYYDWSHYILSNPQEAALLICNVPDDIFPLMDLFWRYKKEKSRFSSEYYTFLNENSFGLNADELEYSYGPAHAYQTPLFLLLATRYWKAVEYIVEFTNSIIDHILKCKPRNEELSKITIFCSNETSSAQYGNYSLWGLYRGVIHVIYPDIMQSMHMALERVLLEFADDERYDKIVMNSFDLILSKSKSVSLTAVVSSVVLAHPIKFRTYALNLFKTIELFHWDTIRLNDESLHSWFYGMDGIRSEIAYKERTSTLQQSFRKRSLESLCVEYQYTRNSQISIEQHSNLLAEVYSVLDAHHLEAKKLDEDIRNIREILLYRIDKRKHKPTVSEAKSGEFFIEMNPQLPAELKKISEDSCAAISDQMRFGSVVIWCEKKFKGEDVSVYHQYEENPLKAIQDAKDVIAAIENRQQLMPMDGFVPANVAATMLLFYENSLTKKDLLFCKKIVEGNILASLRPGYVLQMSNGLELCVHALLVLIRLFPEDKHNYINLLATLLCDHKGGRLIRICDYAIDCLKRCDNQYLLENVMAHYIVMAAGQSGNIKEFVSLDESLKSRLEIMDLECAEVLFELIPKGTDNELYNIFIMHLLPRFAETLKRDKKHSYFSQPRYNRSLYLYKSLAHYALRLETRNIEAFLAPFIKYLDCDSNSLEFIRQFVRAENELKRTTEFWEIWHLLYKPIIKKSIGYNDDVLQAYLLADYLSIPEVTEWHSFGSENFWLYDNVVRDCGDSPATIFAIAKSMNYIASRFVDKGVEWLYEITSKHPAINLHGRERNTIFYMERFIGGFVRKNRSKIRKNKQKKEMLVTILTFMVERNSVQAFMLRDFIV